MRIFMTCITNEAPTCNYRGESDDSNRAMLQKISDEHNEYPFISPESVHNRMRDQFCEYPDIVCNRRRVHDADQLAVRGLEVPNAEKYIDDYYMGYMITDKNCVAKDMQATYPFKRRGLIQINIALALSPYRNDVVFNQSPQSLDNNGGPAPWQNTGTSCLVTREIAFTAFQYPIGINVADCELDHNDPKVRDIRRYWFRIVLKTISELNGVAGNHTRSLYDFSPASVIIRYTNAIAPGYKSYAFRGDHSLPQVVSRILNGSLPGNEFHIGGQAVETMAPELATSLREKGVNLYNTSAQAIDAISVITTGASIASIGAK